MVIKGEVEVVVYRRSCGAGQTGVLVSRQSSFELVLVGRKLTCTHSEKHVQQQCSKLHNYVIMMQVRISSEVIVHVNYAS